MICIYVSRNCNYSCRCYQTRREMIASRAIVIFVGWDKSPHSLLGVALTMLKKPIVDSNLGSQSDHVKDQLL